MTKFWLFSAVAILLLMVKWLPEFQTPESDTYELPQLDVITPVNANKVTSLGYLDGFSDWALFVAFSPDSTMIAASGHHQGAKIWDVVTGKLLRNLACPFEEIDSWTGGVSFSPDGSFIAVGCGLSIRLWNVVTALENENPKPDRILQGSALFTGKIIIDNQGRYLGASSIGTTNDDGSVWLWNLETGKELLAYDGKYFCCPNFNPTSDQFAYSDEMTTHILDIKTLKEISTLPYRSLAITQDWKFSANTGKGKYGQGTAIQLWRDKLDTPSAILLNNDHHLPDHLAFNPNGSLIASGSDYYNMLLWDTKTYERLAALDTAGISDLTFSPDGKMIATSHANTGGSTGDRVYLWGVPAGR